MFLKLKITLILLVSITLFSCSKNDDSQNNSQETLLIGKWRNTEGARSQYLTFKSDGTGLEEVSYVGNTGVDWYETVFSWATSNNILTIDDVNNPIESNPYEILSEVKLIIDYGHNNQEPTVYTIQISE